MRIRIGLMRLDLQHSAQLLTFLRRPAECSLVAQAAPSSAASHLERHAVRSLSCFPISGDAAFISPSSYFVKCSRRPCA